MRLNKYLAHYTGLSRRAADKLIEQGSVTVDGQPAQIGQTVSESDHVTLNGKPIIAQVQIRTIILNKPVGYVCSRNGQGSRTIYELLPKQLHDLKPAGRLDKDSSGLVLLTNDGQLANQLTHPRYGKTKVYQVKIDKKMTEADLQKLKRGVKLDDGLSKFLEISQISDFEFRISMQEGRNRQIRRTFATLGYNIITLKRTQFGSYLLENITLASYKTK